MIEYLRGASDGGIIVQAVYHRIIIYLSFFDLESSRRKAWGVPDSFPPPDENHMVLRPENLGYNLKINTP